MKVIIAGSRGIKDPGVVPAAVEKSGFEITEVVSGCADGVDASGEIWAATNQIPVKRFPANWRPDGPSGRVDKCAGFIRNVKMARYADALIAIYDGSSRGTQHMIKTAERLELSVFVYLHS